MSDFPTIRIKCDPAEMILAGRAAEYGLNDLEVGQDSIISQCGREGSQDCRSFYVRRTRTGVSVRQIIDGRAV